jgi:hypothetical protein
MNKPKFTERDLTEALTKLPTVRMSSACDQHIRRELAQSVPALTTNFWLLTPFAMKKFIAPVAILAVVVAGVGGYAYQSDAVTRGTALYPVKRAIESVALAPSGSPLEQVATYLTLADRRLAEAKVLVGRNDGNVAVLRLVPAAYAQTTADAEPVLAAAPVETTAPVADAADPAAEAMMAVPTPTTVVADGTALAAAMATDTDLALTLAELTATTESAIEQAEEIGDSALTQTALSQIIEAQNVQLAELALAATEADAEEAPVLAAALTKTNENQAEVEVAAELTNEAVMAAKESVVIDIETDEDSETEDEKSEMSAAEEAAAALIKATDAIAAMQADLAASGVDEATIAELTAKATEKLAAAKAALEAGNYGKAEGLAKATMAITRLSQGEEMSAKDHDEDAEDSDENKDEDELKSEDEQDEERAAKSEEDKSDNANSDDEREDKKSDSDFEADDDRAAAATVIVDTTATVAAPAAGKAEEKKPEESKQSDAEDKDDEDDEDDER